MRDKTIISGYFALASRRAATCGALFACSIASLTQAASAADWHSNGEGEFTFVASTVDGELPGQFKNYNVSFRHVPGKPEDSTLRVVVDLREADMGDAELNAMLHDSTWFDVMQHAEAVYESASLSVDATNQLVSSGTLSLKGTDKPATVPFSWETDGGQATMQGQVVIQRTDFNVGSGEWASDDSIGIEVELRFSIELERAR